AIATGSISRRPSSSIWVDLSSTHKPTEFPEAPNVWDLHIRTALGRRRIADLAPYDIESYFRQLKDSGLSQERVRRIRAVLHRSCRLARRWSGNILPNPITDTELPMWSLSERSYDVRAPALEEVKALLTASPADSRMVAFVRLLTATDIRRGEACALRWSDVDRKNSLVNVSKSVVIGRSGVQVKDPKTKASTRRIEVDQPTLHVLESRRRSQEELAAACEMVLGSDAFFFSLEPDGREPPRPDSLSRAFARLRTKAGVADDIHLHSLRHFAATELDSVISESEKQTRLGWSTVQMARHYTDAVSAEDHRAAEHMGRLLGDTGAE
ncbi:MAG: tyrosine-type recombinase/integrase, partial [Acidimicrobiales bacterium]